MSRRNGPVQPISSARKLENKPASLPLGQHELAGDVAISPHPQPNIGSSLAVKDEHSFEHGKEFSDAIIQTIHEPLVVLDKNLKVVRMNEAFAKLFHLSPRLSKGLLFESALNLWWTGNELRSRLESVLQKNVPLSNFEFEVQPRDLGRRILLFNARRLRHKENSTPLLLVALEDITARKVAEEQLAESNRQLHILNEELELRVSKRTKELFETNQQLESFCYSIAHDLRGPLRAMCGLGALLRDDFAPVLGECGKDYVQRIINAGETMDRLIRDLLEYGRLNTVELTAGVVDADQALSNVLDRMQNEIREKKARIERKKKLPMIVGNTVALEAALANLLSNALKFVPEKTVPKVTIWPEEQDGQVRIWIADNGIGIEPKYQKKIFEVFQRLHTRCVYPGTGIGLAIVNRAIQRIGGTVGVESEPGNGSRFWIRLPLAKQNGQ